MEIKCIANFYVVSRVINTVWYQKRDNITIEIFFCSSLVFSVFFLLNLVLWAHASSAAVPFTTLLALLALWFGVSVPLTFIGSYFGFSKRVSFK